jgi:hypothetical protein
MTSCALVALSASAARAGPITFAQYIQTDGSTQQWDIATTGNSTTVTASGSVYFSFSNVPGLPFSGPELANFTFTATSTQFGNCGVSCGDGDSYVQPGYVGTFSFIDAGIDPGANLLSGTFAVTGNPAKTGGQFSSSIGSSGGSFNSSSTKGNLGQLVFTSSFLTFLNSTTENASWSLSSLFPNFYTGLVQGGNNAFPGPLFDASGSGTFSAYTPMPIPEPWSFAILAAGLTCVGFSRQSRMRRT